MFFAVGSVFFFNDFADCFASPPGRTTFTRKTSRNHDAVFSLFIFFSFCFFIPLLQACLAAGAPEAHVRRGDARVQADCQRVVADALFLLGGELFSASPASFFFPF